MISFIRLTAPGPSREKVGEGALGEGLPSPS